MSAEVWEQVYNRLAELIEAHRTTLIFVNTRRLAERVTGKLSQLVGAEKITAYMTIDQKGAQAVFEGLGFSIEAVMRDQVRDPDGRKFDMLILSHDVARVSARHEAYGLNEAF